MEKKFYVENKVFKFYLKKKSKSKKNNKLNLNKLRKQIIRIKKYKEVTLKQTILKENIKILKISLKLYKNYQEIFKLKIGVSGKFIMKKMSLKEKLTI